AFSRPRQQEHRRGGVPGGAGAEGLTCDPPVLSESPPVSRAEREAWTNKPRLPRRTRALTSYPVVRYIGRDDAARTVAGWQPWLDAVAGWLREGRSPTVFIHTPDNVAALELARRFHADVRARVPQVEPLPEPIPPGPPTLFWAWTGHLPPLRSDGENHLSRLPQVKCSVASSRSGLTS